MFSKSSSKKKSKTKRHLKLKKRSILLSNYLQQCFATTNHRFENKVPQLVLDVVLQHLNFHDLTNFMLLNKDTFRYVQSHEPVFWQRYLVLIEVLDLPFYKSSFEKNKTNKHLNFTENDFLQLNKGILSANNQLNPLCIYKNYLTVEDENESNTNNNTGNCLRFIYNPKLFKFQFKLIYQSLFPLYNELINSKLQLQNTQFIKKYNNPIQQSILLNNFLKFSNIEKYTNNSQVYNFKSQILQSIIEFFENACLRECEINYDVSNFQKVAYFTNVLINLNDDLINNNLSNFFLQKINLNDVLVPNRIQDYFIIKDDEKHLAELNMAEIDEYFDKFINLFNQQIKIIDEIFNQSGTAKSTANSSNDNNKIQLILKIFEEILQDHILEFVNLLYNKCESLNVLNDQTIFNEKPSESNFQNNKDSNILIVPVIYKQLVMIINEKILNSQNGGGPKFFKRNLLNLLNSFFENFINLYLNQELEYFNKISNFNISEYDSLNKNMDLQLINSMNLVNSNLEKLNKSSTKRENNNFLKIDLITGFKNIIKPIESLVNNNNNNNKMVQDEIKTEDELKNTLESQRTQIFDEKLQIMNDQLNSIKSYFSLDLSMNIINNARISIQRINIFAKCINSLYENQANLEDSFQIINSCNLRILKNCDSTIDEVFISVLDLLGEKHIKNGFEKAIDKLKSYDAKNSNDDNDNTNEDADTENVQALVVFSELVNIGDLIQNLIEIFYKEEILNKQSNRFQKGKTQDFLSKVVQNKKKFELLLDDNVAEGLNIGIDTLINKIQYTFDTEVDSKIFNPTSNDPTVMPPSGNVTPFAKKCIRLLSMHVKLLIGSTEKSTIDVFQQEISQRFFQLLIKNIKTLKINTVGALTLIADLNYYYDFVVTLRQKQIMPYFIGLKTLGQIYLIDGKDSKLIGKTISDLGRFNGIFQQEEIYELVQCRSDWLKVRKDVEKEMFGMMECILM